MKRATILTTLTTVALIFVIGVWASVGSLEGWPSISAHDELDNAGPIGCPDPGDAYKWSGSSVLYWYPGWWSTTYKNAVLDATTSFNTSDFTYSYTSDDTVAVAEWLDLDQTAVAAGRAGLTAVFMTCSTDTINAVTLGLNFPHFDLHEALEQDIEPQCVAIHEQGHGVGIMHQDEDSPSIMYEVGGHDALCHGGSPIETLQSHDTSDLNAKY